MLPSTVGGDGVRIWLFARNGGGWTSATYSVLIDRIAGVFTLALIVIACLPSTFSLIHDSIPRAVLLALGGRFTGIIGGIVWIAYGLQLRPVQESRSAEAYAENI
jgi:glycosyltransferase 2 family protein